jgi:hypothetical protein
MEGPEVDIDFNGALFKSIHETMAGVLGLKARDNLYLTLLMKFSIPREELPGHMRSLISVMEENFGPSPTRTVSNAIAKRFYSELSLEFVEKPSFTLLDYVEEARTALETSTSGITERGKKA